MVILNHHTRNKDHYLYGQEEPIGFNIENEDEQIVAYEFEIFKMATSFYLTVTQRANLKDKVPELIELIKAHLNKSLKACRWLISQFSNQEVLYEMLLQCPVGDMRKLTVGLIYCAMINLYKDEKNKLDLYWQDKEAAKEPHQRCYLDNFVNILISNIRRSQIYTEYNSQFFQLISRFASLGQEARIYLLKAKMVGRLITHYLQSASPYFEFFIDYSDITFEENETVELGLPIKLENVKLSLWEDLYMRKRDIQVADAHQDYTNIFEALSYLIRSCVFKTEHAPTFVDDLRYTQLHENEYAILQLDEKDIMGLVDSCQTKQSAKHLGSILLHLCQGNYEFDTALRGVLIQSINDKQLEELKPYFPIFKRYLAMQDEHTEERVNEGVREYFNVMKNNSKYTSFMAKFSSYLVKLCNINRNVAELLSSCPEEWDWVIDWIKSNPVTSKSGGQSQQFSKHTREIAASQYKVRRLNDIKNGNIEMHDDEYDSDEDMSNHKFQKEEKIDYMVYTNNYVTAEVVTALDELINIQFIAYNQNKSHWVPVDNEGFAPYLSMQNRHDLKLIEDIRADVEKNIRKTMQQHHQEESGSAQVMSDDRYSHEANENDSVSDEN